MLIFKGAAAEDEVVPRHGTVARELLDLQFKHEDSEENAH